MTCDEVLTHYSIIFQDRGFGAWYFTIWVSVPIFFRLWFGSTPSEPLDIHFDLIGAAVSACALTPFGIALARSRGERRQQAMIAVALGGVILEFAVSILCFGFGCICLWGLGIIVWLPVHLFLPPVLGPVLGLLALEFCRRRSDALSKALALLGIAPAIHAAFFCIASAIANADAPREVDREATAADLAPRPWVQPTTEVKKEHP